MSKFKQYMVDWRYLKISLYIVLTAVSLYVTYFVIKNINYILNAVGVGLGAVLTALSPFFIGLFISYLLYPLVSLIEKNIIVRLMPDIKNNPEKNAKRIKTRRVISVLLTILLFILTIVLIICGFIFLMIGQFTFDSVSNLMETASGYFEKYKASFDSLLSKLPASGIEEKSSKLMSLGAGWIEEHLNATYIMGYIKNIGAGILGVFLGIIIAIYLMSDKELFVGFWNKFTETVFGKPNNIRINSVLGDVNTVFSKFLRGQLLDALIVAVLSSVALTLIGLDFAIFIGCFAGITNIIPYFGPIIGAVPAFIIGVLTDGPVKGILAIVILFVIQQIDGNIIYPKIVGSTVGLHPVTILLAISVGGYFMGILGMVLAVPTAACIKLFCLRYAEKKTEAS